MKRLNGKLDTNSGQIQSLNDSVDELKTRIAKLDKSIQDLQSQLQNIQNPPPGSAPAPGPTAGCARGAESPDRTGCSRDAGDARLMPAPAVSQTPPLQADIPGCDARL